MPSYGWIVKQIYNAIVWLNSETTVYIEQIFNCQFSSFARNRQNTFQQGVDSFRKHVLLYCIRELLTKCIYFISWTALVWFMVFSATFNNISVISWRSVLLVEEIGENHRPVASQWQTFSHNAVSCTPHHERSSNSQL
jgi:hypothetical protein